MLKKMLSVLLVILMLLSVSVTFVYAEETSESTDTIVSTSDEVATKDESASVDEARDYLLSLIESMDDVNEDFYTEESYYRFVAVKEYAESVSFYDGVTEEQLYRAADELEAAYNALEGLILGDVNGDREVNIKDATEIQKSLADLVTLSDKRLVCADINRNGVCNIRDATLIQKHLAYFSPLTEARFIKNELHIIDLKYELLDTDIGTLKTRLFELMEYGEGLTVDNKYEMESYYRYIEADRKASSAYRDKWPFEEDPLDVTDALVNLELAIEGLIPADELPKVPDDGTVKFKAEYEYRIYNSCFGGKNTNFLIDNLQDLKTIVSEAGKDYDYSNEISIPPRYNNEEFFEENSIVVSLFVVGGTGCEQWFDALTVEGTNLTIHRTVTRPLMYPPDIDYRFTLIEVSKADIEGVTQIINDTDYVIIAENADP